MGTLTDSNAHGDTLKKEYYFGETNQFIWYDCIWCNIVFWLLGLCFFKVKWLDQIILTCFKTVWYQTHDICEKLSRNLLFTSDPPHYATALCNYVNKAFSLRIIDQCAGIEMPPCMSDITPMDFLSGIDYRFCVLPETINNWANWELTLKTCSWI